MRGCILAGGLSSRFGSDKAVFPIDGVPMAVRLARVLGEAGLSPILVARHARGLGIPELLEPDGPRHPLWGVAHALADGDAFFCPCDVTDLTVEVVTRLLEARAVAHGQPLCGFIPASRRTDALRLATEGRPVRELGLPTLDVGRIANRNVPPRE